MKIKTWYNKHMYNNQIFINKKVMNIKDKLKLHVDLEGFNRKPTSSEVKKINYRITKEIKTIDLKELKNIIENGHTIMPSLMPKGRLNSNFEKTELIFLDFDNKEEEYISYEEMKKNTFVSKHACIIYKTFSDTEENNRYRVIFRMKRPITNQQDFKCIVNNLLAIFPSADTSCKDISRLFYGGKFAEIINEKNILDNDYICNLELNNPKKIYDIDRNNIKVIHDKQVDLDLSYYNPKDNSNEITNLIIQNKYIEYRNRILPLLDVDFTHIQTKRDMIFLINSLDLSVLLGIPKETSNSFSCLLTNDDNPSSSIFKIPDKSIYMYKRFGDKENSFTVIEVFQILLNTKSIEKVIQFFKRTFNINYSVPYSHIKRLKAVRELLEYFDTNTLDNDYKSVQKVLKSNKNAIIMMLRYLLESPSKLSNESDIVYLSAKSSYTLPKLLYNGYSDYLRKKSNILTNVLTYLKIIKKLNVEDYPKELTTYYKSNRGTMERKIQNVFVLNLEYFTDIDDVLATLEKDCKYLIEMGHTFKGFTQDYVTSIESQDTANEVYTQSKNKQVSKNFQNMFNYLETYLTTKLEDEKSYILLKDIKKELIANGNFTRNSIDTHFNNVLGILINNLSLEKKKVSKAIKSEFDIDTDGFPHIIYKKK